MIMPSIHDGNVVYVNQRELAKDLRVHEAAVSRSIRRLLAVGVFEKWETMAGRTLRLNPNFGWYGADNGAHTAAVRQWNKAHDTVQ